MDTSTALYRAIIIPGNGCTPVRQCNWYAAMQADLQKTGLFSEVILKDMPDPYEAKEDIWIPFIKKELGIDMRTIVIGHSSGAVAAMRLLEEEATFGCVLVAACYTDLGCESERISNYYSRPWRWDRIQDNTQWILQYHSVDDPLIPIDEGDYVAAQLHSEYTKFSNRSHFFTHEHILDISRHITRKIDFEATC